MNLVKILFPVAFLVFSNTAIAQNAEAPPSHCASTEFVVLNATMGQFVRSSSGRTLKKNGKVLSLCADVPAEPYERVAYRYGNIGHVELERIATVQNKFGLSSRSTGPHTGEEVLFFKAGKINYYVISATGQGNGVSLLVFQSGKRIADLFSGTSPDTDFQVGPAYVDYDNIKSPVFALTKVTDSF